MAIETSSVTEPRWPALDQDFLSTVIELGATEEGEALRRKAEARFMYAEGKPFLLGPPLLVQAELAEILRGVTSAYHRAIERIVEASRDDDRVRGALSTPPALAADLAEDTDPRNGKVHVLRLDTMLDPQGGFWILETNANCPGGFVFSGICNRAWREFLEGHGVEIPPALEHEKKGFMADWLVRVIEEDTGVRPDFIALLREEGGNRLELGDFAKHIRWQDIECEEVDPREITYDRSGPPGVRGRRLTHAYQKLGMQPFQRMRSELDAFVAAVRDRALFVQNGQRGRWVGDDKLCLAIMSDPAFEYLFDAIDLELIRRHLPWSRNARLLDIDRLSAIRDDRTRYVLKRGLDTRGKGVVVGRGVEEDEWGVALDTAVEEAWLVQEFHETSWVQRDFDADETQRHDLALGAINGELTSLFARSSGELRVNMSRTGRMHPVFLGC